jgi:opacity protein-like surface antigen
MKIRLLILMVLCCLVASAAYAQDVTYNFMPGTDFSKYHTYKWVTIEGGAHPNQIVDAEIKQSVDSQLSAKGFTKTDSDKADMYVGYQIAVDQEKQWNG